MTPAARQPLLSTTPPALLMAVPLLAAKAVLPLVKVVLPAAKAALVERWEALQARDKRWVEVMITMVAVAGETE